MEVLPDKFILEILVDKNGACSSLCDLYEVSSLRNCELCTFANLEDRGIIAKTPLERSILKHAQAPGPECPMVTKITKVELRLGIEED